MTVDVKNFYLRIYRKYNILTLVESMNFGIIIALNSIHKNSNSKITRITDLLFHIDSYFYQIY